MRFCDIYNLLLLCYDDDYDSLYTCICIVELFWLRDSKDHIILIYYIFWFITFINIIYKKRRDYFLQQQQKYSYQCYIRCFLTYSRIYLCCALYFMCMHTLYAVLCIWWCFIHTHICILLAYICVVDNYSRSLFSLSLSFEMHHKCSRFIYSIEMKSSLRCWDDEYSFLHIYVSINIQHLFINNVIIYTHHIIIIVLEISSLRFVFIVVVVFSL